MDKARTIHTCIQSGDMHVSACIQKLTHSLKMHMQVAMNLWVTCTIFHLISVQCCYSQGHMEGGFLGFQETPFDSKTIAIITCLNK